MFPPASTGTSLSVHSSVYHCDCYSFFLCSKGGGDDRFIIRRNTINFNGFLESDTNSDSEITQQGVKEAYRSRYTRLKMEEALNVSTSFKLSKNRAERPRLYWSFKPRSKPMMALSQLLGTPVLGSQDHFSNLADISPEGKLVAKFKRNLTESKGFLEKPGELEKIEDIEARLVTALWLPPNGEEIFLGYWGGTMAVYLGKSKPIDDSIIFGCPGIKGQGRMKTFCIIRCILKHPTRDLVYWSSEKGILSKTFLADLGQLSGLEKTQILTTPYLGSGLSKTTLVAVKNDSYRTCRHGLFSVRKYVHFKSVEKAHKKRTTSMKISPNGSYLATASLKEGVKVWDALTLRLIHHLLNGSTIAKALDWHPWEANLLATGICCGGEGKIYVWKCSQEKPLVKEFFYDRGLIFVLRFHPISGELVYAQWKQGDSAETDFRKGETTIVVLNGLGEVVDCSPSPKITGLITQLFWSPDGTELLAGGSCDILVKFHFFKKPNIKRPKKESSVQNFNLAVISQLRLITAYRENGHLIADTNPVRSEPKPAVPELEADQYILNTFSSPVNVNGFVRMGKEDTNLKEVVTFLQDAYCGRLSSELGYLPSKKKEWLAAELESAVNLKFENEVRKQVAKVLIESEVFDKFLGTRFPTLKRYGLEGAEGMLAFFVELFKQQNSCEALVLAMTHRGRLNLLTGLLQIPPALVFSKIRGGVEMAVDSPLWTGDVLSHLICSEMIGSTKVTMLPNPSHLELVNPVSMGKTRARQMRRKIGSYSKDGARKSQVLNVQVHGDAAFAGQGVNQEMLQFSRVPHFTVGGSIHLLVNNQLGFTTPGERGRSTRYASDLAKAIEAPIIQVNGDDPEALMKATRIAVKFQEEFGEDVFVEMHCYRRRGHNELDDPTFTNPVLYKTIHQMKTLPNLYKDLLLEDNVVSENEVSEWKENYTMFLSDEFKTEIRPPQMHLQNHWTGLQQAGRELTTWETGVDVEVLRYLGLRSVTYPSSFRVHPHLEKTHVKNRERLMMEPDTASLDWSTAEALAFGSLLIQGFNVRISGQDVGRGTFSQRHVMLVDQDDGDMLIPLNDCGVPNQGYLEVANSILSEEAVLAYEYGVSIENPKTLAIWEAQFGDFVNGAQNVVDTYISSGEAKWGRSTSLTMLLPHGYDGAGPEHSSCRVERFLQLTNSSETCCDADCVNLQVAWPSTPAQYFHLLRRQQVRNFRSPLIVVSAKTLLRLSAATSKFSELGPGTHYQNVIAELNPKAQTMVFTAGKHFYTLVETKPDDVVLVRLESLVPFPTSDLQAVIADHPKVKQYIWSQEEPRNMGAWSFVRPRFENLVGIRPHYVGRPTLPTPAYGLAHRHKASHEKIISDVYG